MLFIISFLCIGFSVRKKFDKNVYTVVRPCTLWEGVAQWSRKLSARFLVRDVATKESWSRDASILPKHFTVVEKDSLVFVNVCT